MSPIRKHVDNTLAFGVALCLILFLAWWGTFIFNVMIFDNNYPGPEATIFVAIFHLVGLIVTLFVGDWYVLFSTKVWPKLEPILREKAKKAEEAALKRQQAKEAAARLKDIRSARAKAMSYYEEHSELLAGLYPEALFQSALNAAIPENLATGNPWVATQALIERLEPIIAQGRERQRQAEERQRQLAQERQNLVNEIAKSEAQIQQWLTSGFDPEVVNDEVAGIRQRIGALRATLDSLLKR